MTFDDYVKDVIAATNFSGVEALMEEIEDAYERDSPIFIIGNGGSAANASHLAEDLGKGVGVYKSVISLTDNVAYITAIANDLGYEQVFAEQLKSLAVWDDLLIAISCSGNSPNIVEALYCAADIGMRTFGITGGNTSSPLCRLADRVISVPSDDVGLVEAVHGIVFHYIVGELRERYNGS